MFHIFTEHPSSMEETYLQHMGQAFRISFKSLGISIVSFIHGIFPFLFVNTASDSLYTLNDHLQYRRGLQV